MVILKKMIFPLFRKYLRLFLSMIITAILGISLMVSLWGVYANLSSELDSYIKTYGHYDGMIETSFQNRDLSDVLALESVEEVNTRLSLDCMVSYQEKQFSARVFTYKDTDFMKFYVWDEKKSDSLPNVKVDYQYAKHNHISVGDSIEITYVNLNYLVNVGEIVSSPETCSIKQNRFSWGESNEFGYIYMEDSMVDFTAVYGFYNQILLKSSKDKSNEEMLEDVMNLLGDSLPIYDHYTYKDSMLAISIEVNLPSIYKLITVLPVFFFIIIMLVVFLFMLQIMNMERKNVGIYKALGFSNHEIIRLYLASSLIISFIAVFFGGILGYFIETIALILYRDNYSLVNRIPFFHVNVFLLTGGITILVCLIASFMSAILVFRISPIEAMSQQDFTKKSFTFLRKASLPKSIKLCIARILRNWKRFLLSSLCIASTVILMIISLCYSNAGVVLLNQTFELRFHYDAIVYYQNKVEDSLLAKYENQSYITKCQDAEIGFLDFSFNGKKGSTTIIAMDNTSMMQIPDETGKNTIPIFDDGIILSSRVADSFGIKKGDYITIHNKKVKVSEISTQYVSPFSYMSITSFEKLDCSYYGAILVKMSDESQFKAFVPKTSGYVSMEFVSNQSQYAKKCLSLINIAILLVIIVSLILGFVVIYNISQINLNETKKDMAIMKTLGVSESYISLEWSFQSLVQFVFAILIGIPIGFLFGSLFVNAMKNPNWIYPFQADFWIVLVTILCTLLYVLLSNQICIKQIKKWNLAELTRSKE